MSELKLLVIITQQKYVERILKEISVFGTKFHTVYKCKGTATNQLLEVLGIGEEEKSLIACTVLSKDVEKIDDVLLKKFHFNLKQRGVSFTLPIGTVGGPATLKILSGVAVENAKRSK